MEIMEFFSLVGRVLAFAVSFYFLMMVWFPTHFWEMSGFVFGNFPTRIESKECFFGIDPAPISTVFSLCVSEFHHISLKL
jgi:hypothetical protein